MPTEITTLKTPPGAPPLRALYSIAEAAALLGASRSQLYRLMADGLISARKAGKRTLIPASEVERYVAALPTATFRGGSAAR